MGRAPMRAAMDSSMRIHMSTLRLFVVTLLAAAALLIPVTGANGQPADAPQGVDVVVEGPDGTVGEQPGGEGETPDEGDPDEGDPDEQAPEPEILEPGTGEEPVVGEGWTDGPADEVTLGASQGPASGGGTAPSGYLPFSGIGHVLFAALLGFVSMVGGVFLYRYANLREPGDSSCNVVASDTDVQHIAV